MDIRLKANMNLVPKRLKIIVPRWSKFVAISV